MPASSGAHEIHGAIWSKYVNMIRELSILGYPTTDEQGAGHGGRASDFQGGAIYWSPTTGAHEDHGAIRDKFASLGYEYGFLGLPTSDEIPVGRGGRAQVFQGGIIYWSPSTGAHEVHGAILQKYASASYESSFLGLPTSDEFAFNGGRRSNFQGGYILWTPAGGAKIFAK